MVTSTVLYPYAGTLRKSYGWAPTTTPRTIVLPIQASGITSAPSTMCQLISRG